MNLVKSGSYGMANSDNHDKIAAQSDAFWPNKGKSSTSLIEDS